MRAVAEFCHRVTAFRRNQEDDWGRGGVVTEDAPILQKVLVLKEEVCIE